MKCRWFLDDFGTEIDIYCENGRQSIELVKEILKEFYMLNVNKSLLYWYPNMEVGKVTDGAIEWNEYRGYE